MAERLPDESMSRNAGWDLYLDLFADSRRAVPFSLAGYSAVCEFRAVEGDQESTLLATASIVIGTRDALENFVADPAGNCLHLSLTRAQIAAVEPVAMYADVLVGPTGSPDPMRVAYFRALIGEGESAWPT